MSESLTVGKLCNFLSKVPPDTEITFGSSKYRMRPLVFYRFKMRGDDLLQIELNEIDGNFFGPISEIDSRPTAERFLEFLTKLPADVEITFGASLDAVPLEFRDLSIVVGINLEQTVEPKWKVRGD